MKKVFSTRTPIKAAVAGALMCSALLAQSYAVADFSKRPTAFKCVAYSGDGQMRQMHFAVEAPNLAEAMLKAKEVAQENGKDWTVQSCIKV